MFRKRLLACSFCGKSAANVGKLVAGRKAYICDTCAAEVQRIMSRSDSDPGSHPSNASRARPAPSSWWLAVKDWIRARRRGGASRSTCAA